MAKPYSLDLRQKVIDAIELDGLKKSEASVLFQISRNTIDLWLKRRAATGCLEPTVGVVSTAQGKIQDWEAFRAFAEQHRSKTQAEMAELWSCDVSRRTISRALKKIGFTRKKRLMATASAMNQNGARL
jgi:transposase